MGGEEIEEHGEVDSLGEGEEHRRCPNDPLEEEIKMDEFEGIFF